MVWWLGEWSCTGFNNEISESFRAPYLTALRFRLQRLLDAENRTVLDLNAEGRTFLDLIAERSSMDQCRNPSRRIR